MVSLEDRSALVQRCTDRSSSCDFYRNLYALPPEQAALTVRSEQEWRMLPLLTKNEIVRYPPSKRTFVPLPQADSLYVSSGTSGNPPLFMLRQRLEGWEYRAQYTDFRHTCLSSINLPHRAEYLPQSMGRPVTVVAFDPRQPGASVRLAQATGVTTLFLHTHVLATVGVLMARAGIAERIKLIDMAGEPCSLSLYAFIRSTFPNATVVSNYGASEVDGPFAVTCHPLTDTHPREEYHPLEGFFIEIIDPDTGVVLEPTHGTEGEAVITAHTAGVCCFPLVRYRIGDMVRVVEEKCEQHGQWSFVVLGRAGMDFLKIPGGVLRADEIGRVLRGMKKHVTDDFSVHVGEESGIDGAPRTTATLFVHTRQPLDMTKLARDIECMLRVGPASTYADGVARGMYSPLVCKEAPADTPLKKQKRIVRER